MKISVIIPIYNRAHMLTAAARSVLGQTLPSDELIVVDDGSEDRPEKALDEIGDDRARLIAQPNRGVSAARNAGVRAARHEWLAFLDSDDYWLPTKLERQIAWHLSHPDVLISQTDEVWIRNGRRINPRKYHLKPEGDVFAGSLERCLISPSAVLIHRQVLNDVGLFDEDLPVCEDYDLWLRIGCRYSVGLVPEKLVVKTGGHADQLSQRYWGMDRFRVSAIKKLLDSGVLTESQRQAALAEMRKKIEVLRQGAEKRDNNRLLTFCDELASCGDTPTF